MFRCKYNAMCATCSGPHNKITLMKHKFQIVQPKLKIMRTVKSPLKRVHGISQNLAANFKLNPKMTIV